VDIRKRKTVILIWLFNVALGLIILPLLIRPRSIVAWWILVAKGALLLAVAIVAAATIHWAASIRRLWLARRALFRGNYERALQQMDKVKAVAGYEFRAVILILAGRPQEAEAIIAKLGSEARDPMERARRLTILAELLMDQGRWEQAKEALAEAIRNDAGVGSPCVGLADWYLLQGLEPQRASDLVDQANNAPGIAALKLSVRESTLAFRSATKALALARLGRHRESESAIAEAFRLADVKHVPGMAHLHWRAGLTFAAIGQRSKAREHAQEASAIDPHGKYGKLAAGWLDEDVRIVS